LLETIVEDKKDFLAIEERKAEAMETIALCLQKLAGTGSGAVDPIGLQNEAVEIPAGTAVSESMDEATAPAEMTVEGMIEK